MKREADEMRAWEFWAVMATLFLIAATFAVPVDWAAH